MSEDSQITPLQEEKWQRGEAREAEDSCIRGIAFSVLGDILAGCLYITNENPQGVNWLAIMIATVSTAAGIYCAVRRPIHRHKGLFYDNMIVTRTQNPDDALYAKTARDFKNNMIKPETGHDVSHDHLVPT